MPWIVVLGNREAIDWVWANDRFAVSPRVQSFPDPDDKLVFYVTRGAYKSPGHDYPEVVGFGRCAGPVLHKDVEIAGTTYARSFPIAVDERAGRHEGLNITDITGQLELIKRPEVWGTYLRRPLVKISDKDYKTIASAFAKRSKKAATSLR